MEKKEAISLTCLAPHVKDKNNEQKLDICEVPSGLEDQFTSVYFLWLDKFITYHKHNMMQEKREKLLVNLDPISQEYIERHESLLELCKLNQHCLVKQDFVWTSEDRKLFAAYLAHKESGKIRFLQNVDLSWGTCYTNKYGMYDLDEKVLQAIDGKDIIDAGAYTGDTLMLLREMFPNSLCHSFEPDSDNYLYLTRAFARDIKAQKIKTYNQALGDKRGHLTLSKAQSSFRFNESASLAYDFYNTEQEQKVEVITLDDFVKEHNLQVGLIKVDIEGFEQELIKGALNTIKEQKPVLVIGFYHFPEEFYELKPYLESLNLGYKFMVRRSNFVQDIRVPPAVPLYDLVLIAY